MLKAGRLKVDHHNKTCAQATEYSEVGQQNKQKNLLDEFLACASTAPLFERPPES